MDDNDSQSANPGIFLTNILMLAAILAMVIIVLGFASYVLKDLGYSFSSNALEKAIKVGVSKKQDFQDFQNDGGLNSADSWKRYKVISVNTLYENNDETLSYVSMVIRAQSRMKNASINNLKKSLTKECGSNWEDSPFGAGLYASNLPLKGGLYCLLLEMPDSNIQVTLSRSP